MKHFLYYNLQSAIRNLCAEQRFVYQTHAVAANAEHEEGGHETHARRRGGPETVEANMTQFSPEVVRLARLASASGNPAQERLVDELLEGRLQEAAFRQQMEQLEAEEESFGAIFKIQREIRKKIADLHLRTKSYIDVIPEKRRVFQGHLTSVRALNANDARVDSELKGALHALTRPARDDENPLLSASQAEKIYRLDPKEGDFEKDFKSLTKKLQKTPEGKKAAAKIFALKAEERDIERRFDKLYSELERILEDNLSLVRREADKKRMMKRASEATGITIRTGTVIRYAMPGIWRLFGKQATVAINGVTFEEVPIRDKITGKIISYSVGVPIVHLSDNREMQIGRFKKWVDATDAVEEVFGLTDVMTRLGWNVLGLKLAPGVALHVPHTKRDPNTGELKTSPETVRIKDIKNNRIVFESPIKVQKGPVGESGRSLEEEFAESLTFPEFVKWYRRMEVEKSLELEELRTVLKNYNKNFNKDYGVNTKKNPPITVTPGELLYFVDGSEQETTIKEVTGDHVKLSNGQTLTMPEFLYWVRNNYVQKRPEDKPAAAVLDEASIKHPDAGRNSQLTVPMEKPPSALEGHDIPIEDLAAKVHGGITGYLQHLWSSTTLLSLKDCWGMVLSVKEFIERKHQRRSKARYSEVGKKLPRVLGVEISTEFERISQAAENEEVHQYQEAMEQWGIFQILDTLYATNSKDEGKACFLTLIEKGELRWDEEGVWKTLNRLTARYTSQGAALYIPPKSEMPFGKSGEDMMIPAIDALWGEGQGNEWYSSNINKYNSNKGAYEHKGKQLDSDPKNTGGLGSEETRLLEQWCKGEYVSPHEYEELIDFGIKYGKMTAEQKMFFLFAGVAAQCGVDSAEGAKQYGTLIHIDRPSALDGDYLNQFPILDYFRQRKKYNPLTGALRPVGPDGKPIAFTEHEFHEFWHHWRHEGEKQAREEGKPIDYYYYRPGKAFAKFLWEEIILDPGVRVRLSKGLRAARKIDHDDTHMFVPPGTIAEIETITRGPAGGGELNFTPEGYANVYPGYNQFFTSILLRLGEHPDEKKSLLNTLITSMQGFVTFDAIMDERLHKREGLNRGRLHDLHYDKTAVVDDSCKVRLHQIQVRNFITTVANAYHIKEPAGGLYGRKTGSIKDETSQDYRNQIQYERELQNFATELDTVLKSDGGEKLFRILSEFVERGYDEHGKNDEFALRGLQGSKREKSQEEAQTAESAGHSG